jgi:phage terminase large subunit-like protein
MALSLICAKHAGNPKFRAAIFRRTFPEFTDPGGLVDETSGLYPAIGGRFNSQKMDWVFPSGARVSFRHLQYEKTVYRYQGAQICYLCFDELTHFTEFPFWYLLSRNRSTCGVKPVIRATCNPDPDSFAAKLIDWYLDPDGYPDPAKAGKVRYFYRAKDEMNWDDDRDRLTEHYLIAKARPQTVNGIEYGAAIKIRNEWVTADNKDKLIEKVLASEKLRNSIPIKSFTFLPSTIFENKKLLEINPEYLDNLENLHPVERERLLKGNWKIAFAAGTIFQRTWFEIIEEMPEAEFASVVRFWDLAATDKISATKNSSYTVGAKLAKFPGEYYVLMDLVIVQITGGEVEKLIQQTAILDGDSVAIRLEKEGGSSGKILEEQFTMNFEKINPNIDFQSIKPVSSKLSRALPLATAASFNRIKLLKGDWNADFLNAVGQFDGITHLAKINDIIDATDGAYNELKSIVPVHISSIESTERFIGVWT